MATRKPDESTQEYLKRIAKQADQRLVRLEKLSGETGFKKVKNWSYAKAKQNTKRWGGEEGKPRFNKNLSGLSEREMRSKIKDIEEFLSAPTSQKSTIIKSYKQRAESVNESQGTNLSWEDLANFFENSKNEANFKRMGSGDMFRVLSTMKSDQVQIVDKKGNVKSGEKAIKYLDKAIKEDKDLTDIIQVEDENVKDSIIELLTDKENENLLTARELFNLVK